MQTEMMELLLSADREKLITVIGKQVLLPLRRLHFVFFCKNAYLKKCSFIASRSEHI